MRAAVWLFRWYTLPHNRERGRPNGRLIAWARDQAFGFFGYTPATKERPGQPLHRFRLDLDEVLEETEDVVRAYLLARSFPQVAPFSGGVLDAWPRRAAEAFAICQDEEAAVSAFERGKG